MPLGLQNRIVEDSDSSCPNLIVDFGPIRFKIQQRNYIVDRDFDLILISFRLKSITLTIKRSKMLTIIEKVDQI